jgi:hypothetical protein
MEGVDNRDGLRFSGHRHRVRQADLLTARHSLSEFSGRNQSSHNLRIEKSGSFKGKNPAILVRKAVDPAQRLVGVCWLCTVLSILVECRRPSLHDLHESSTHPVQARFVNILNNVR